MQRGRDPELSTQDGRDVMFQAQMVLTPQECNLYGHASSRLIYAGKWTLYEMNQLLSICCIPIWKLVLVKN
ncbi:hypothetical protein EVAR_65110_1 [Eumeta japonica]|uniref:Uncharacterized protein n=1 Tax=Eumeta variegata TaxID=151549 RepID=A0A4C1ZRW7_EUMVA|nr:hypothetical protein EVAR_65110_1 [Eumeta japonica]